MHDSISLNRRLWLLAGSASVLALPACSESEAPLRARNEPSLTPEQRRLRYKFKDVRGGQLVVDAFGEKHAVTIFDEEGRVFYTRATVSSRNRSVHSYGAEFGVPLTLRAMWRREGERVGGAIQNPIRGTDIYGIYEGGTVVGDYTVPVADRIPEVLLAELRRNKHVGLRLKLRLHDDGLLVGWDLASPVDSIHVGGDFQEAHLIYESDLLNPSKRWMNGWYFHPKTGQKIETDF